MVLPQAFQRQGPLSMRWAATPQGPRILMVPKVGSTSLQQLPVFQDQPGPNPAIFVRNPVERILSAWKHKIMDQNQYRTGPVELETLVGILVQEKDEHLDHHLTSQVWVWSEALKGAPRPPLFRFDGFNRWLRRWGITSTPWENRSGGGSISISEDIRIVLEKRYAADLEAWRGAI